MGSQSEIANHRHEEEVPVVAPIPVLCPLPIVGVRCCRELQLVSDLPSSGLVGPTERRKLVAEQGHVQALKGGRTIVNL